MHRHGIACALWQAARRLVTARHSLRIAVGFVLASAVATAASAGPVEYDYVGTNFTTVTGVFTTSDFVTGSVIFDSPLIPNQANGFVNPGKGQPLPFAFTLSDGVNTISSSAVGAGLAGSGAVFVTDIDNHIVRANFGGTLQTGSGLTTQSNGIIILPGGSEATSGPANSGFGESFTAGTWSGPTTPSPQPSLYLTATAGGPTSLSGDPLTINASLTLATTAPSGSVTLATLPAGVTTLQQAAAKLGYQAFGWMQLITIIPDPSPKAECSDPACSPPSIPITSKSVPLNDPPLNGYVYSGSPSPGQYAFPLYYNYSDIIGNPSLCIQYSFSGSCVQTLQNSALTQLNFFDGPSDLCIAGPSPGFLALDALAILAGKPEPCGGIAKLAPAGSHLGFTTQLVGLTSSFAPGSPCSGPTVTVPTCISLGGFTWTDDFNGIPIGALGSFTGSGGVDNIAVFDASLLPDASSGTGGITIVSINNGNPVPEPSPLGVLVFATGLIWVIRRNGWYAS